LSNKTSPITDGVDGFTGDNAHTLRARVMELLQDVDLAQTIGARGRETVADKFPIKAFVDKWRAVIEEAAAGKPNSQKRVPSHAGRNILLHYAATPITTGRYFETAARKHHRVVTAGFRCPEEVLQVWGFTRPYPSYAPQQIDLPLRDTGDEIIKNLPGDFTPDLFLWIDSGAETAPAGLDKLSCPKACFLIDTHIDPGLRLPIARLFDFTFLAQKAQVSLFEGEGIKNVHWLPLACSPELHNLPQPARDIDVAFVGSLTNRSNQRRARLLAEVKRRFPDACIAQLWPDEMANTYARSKIVLNISVKRDVNMRVFEAMASGAMLVTDDADGLADLFEEGRHLAVYHNDDDACDIIEKYLRDDAGRAAIADAGQRLVLSKHTYERRVAEIVSVMEEGGALKMETQPAAMNMFYYQSVRPEVLQFVPVSARRVLDVGCGCGAFGGALKQMGVPEVHGIELVEAPCAEARKILDSATCGNIEQMDMAFGDGYFDCITFNDVLEHLVNPAGALRKAARCLADHGVIMASLPNVRFFQVVGMLANGRWEYTDAGILDRTHLRFFTAREMEGLVRDAGLELLEIRPLSMLLPEQAPLNSDGSLDMGCMTIQPLDEKDRDDLLTYQYLIVAGKTGVDRLEPARAAIEQGAYGTAYAYALDARAVNAMERKRIMAKSAAHIGRMPEAEKLYRELVDSDPRDGVAVGELGILLVAMNRLDEARPLLECAGLQDPANDKITGALGLLFAAQGDHAQAFVHLREALEASREHHGLLGPFIGVAESVGRLADAETVAAQYADFLPANETVVMLYAELLITLGRPREAVDRIDAFLAFNPDSVAARSLLAAAKKAAQS
jgi:2-polyprenyl-3-methyl-5-hydroxy-6-metoxy-1,4-benzoquinol methylase/Tfp pilus assembly protein PilF